MQLSHKSESSNFENFCGGQVWDQNLTWDTAIPIFTPCFQKTVLVWTPCAFIWWILPFYLLYLWKRSQTTLIQFNKLNVIKSCVVSLLLVTDVVNIVHTCFEYFDEGGAVYFVSPAVHALTMVLILAIIQLDRLCAVVSNGALFTFWLLSLLCSGLSIYSSIISAFYQNNGTARSPVHLQDLFRFSTCSAQFVLMAVSFVLACFADSPKERDTVENITPEANASFPSSITYSWFDRLVFTKLKHSLDTNMWKLDHSSKSSVIGPAFQKLWNRKVERVKRLHKGVEQENGALHSSVCSINNGNIDAQLLQNHAHDDSTQEHAKRPAHRPSLLVALVQHFGPEMLKSVALNLCADVLVFLNPMILDLLMTYVDSKDAEEWKGYLYSALFLMATIMISLIRQRMLHISTYQGQRVRSSLISTIYKKALTMTCDARKASAVGEIVNLMSVDCGRIQMAFLFINFLWGCPVQVILACYLSWGIVGSAAFAGLAVMLLVIPINAIILTYLRKYQFELMEHKDKRIKLFSEVLGGIKMLKLYAWEPAFEDKIKFIRKKELSLLKKIAKLDAAVAFMFTMLPFVTCLVVYATFILMDSGHILDANTAFVYLSYINILRQPINKLPFLLTYIVQAMVSIKRIEIFLNHDDLLEDDVIKDENCSYALTVTNGMFSWGESEIATLKCINLSIREGSLVAVVGQVGSGKSSLVSAFLGELKTLQGGVKIKGSVAYVSQQPWLQNATIKDNILFGFPLDEERYRLVIDACALNADFKAFNGGDQCEIGEKGLNLSGGQKQRIALARAVYSDADIFLLDDPLSSVDSRVGKCIFDKALGKHGLLKNKTRVLVTHNLQWLPLVDKIVVMADGRILETGTWEELLTSSSALTQFMNNMCSFAPPENNEGPFVKTAITEDDIEADKVTVRCHRSSSATSGDTCADEICEALDRQELCGQDIIYKELHPNNDYGEADENDNKFQATGPITLVDKETSQYGKVKRSVFLVYMKAIGVRMFAIILLFAVIYQGSSIFANIWLSKWTDNKTLLNSSLVNTSEYTSVKEFYLMIYGVCGLTQGIAILIFTVTFTVSSVSAARLLHSRMLHRILRAPMSFFDKTPSGRIVNRFAKDVEIIDSTLADSARTTITCLLTVVGSISVICYSTPLFAAVIVPVGLVYYLLQLAYIPVSRQLKRMESVTRSPVYSYFGETLAGASTIRAFSAQKRFVAEIEKRIDQNLVYSFAGHACNRWLTFRLDVLGAFIVFATSLFSVLNKNSRSTAGLVGLAVSYALQVTSGLNWLIRISSALETNIVSVERVKEYSEVEQEAPWSCDEKAHRDWPESGAISFNNLHVRYRNNQKPVIQGLTCNIQSKEKVGIVGRTGAGKSSLTMSLFRIIEAASGYITIDGIGIEKLGLHDLRSTLTILPQEPFIFSGTVRMNLDPFDEYSDECIRRALEHAHLKDFIDCLPGKLYFECGESGANLSVGQRQLVCLARSLLKKTKILILDEATAAVDLETDELIQRTIRREFADCTVMTIAHRLNTIVDNDKVMVLDHGKIIEYDSPHTLLKNRQSTFYAMAKDAGITT